MKILVLNLYYPPDTSATAYATRQMAEALAAHHNVTVICGRPSYDPLERRPWRLWQQESAGGVRIIRVGSTDYPRFRMKLRALNYLTYAKLCGLRALFERCDVIVAMTDPPFEGISAAALATLKRKPFVYHISDLYPDMALGGGIVSPGILASAWEAMHRWALRRAARIVVLGEDMKARVVSKGIHAAKIEVVRTGAVIPPPGWVAETDPEVIRSIRGSARFIALHAGNLGFYGVWGTLLEAARQVRGSGIELVFVGDGAQRSALESEARGLPNVRFLPFFSAEKISSVLAAADVHLITVQRGLEGVVVPSKLYGILAAGKPVLAVAPCETEVAHLARVRGFGVAADPDRPAEVAGALSGLAAHPDRLQAMCDAARAAAPAFERSAELQKFVRVVESAAPH
jgi:glycosyltransferase involved in cell wall biosynthesis